METGPSAGALYTRRLSNIPSKANNELCCFFLIDLPALRACFCL